MDHVPPRPLGPVPGDDSRHGGGGGHVQPAEVLPLRQVAVVPSSGSISSILVVFVLVLVLELVLVVLVVEVLVVIVVFVVLVVFVLVVLSSSSSTTGSGYISSIRSISSIGSVGSTWKFFLHDSASGALYVCPCRAEAGPLLRAVPVATARGDDLLSWFEELGRR